MGRRRIVAGNWKMNKTPTEAVALVEELKPLVKNDDVDVVFCVPAIDIIPVVLPLLVLPATNIDPLVVRSMWLFLSIIILIGRSVFIWFTFVK